MDGNRYMWQNGEVAKALRDGSIKKPSNCSGCFRGENEVFIEAHHPDYDKPHDVIWLCKECHLKLHKKIKSKAGRKPKPHENKSKETMVVYFTEEQKEVVLNYCGKIDIPFSVLVRQLLNEKGIL